MFSEIHLKKLEMIRVWIKCKKCSSKFISDGNIRVRAQLSAHKKNIISIEACYFNQLDEKRF